MNRVKSILVFVAIAFAWVSTYAGNPSVAKQFINHKDWNFVENKGQIPLPPLKKGESASINRIRYYGHQGGVYLYCFPGKISFVFTKVEGEKTEQVSEATSQPSGFPLPKGAGGFGRNKNQPSKITTNRADLILLNSNPSCKIFASDQQEYYENYYTTGNADSGITNVHTYKTITYKEIYPHVDLVLHCREKGMKYEFVVYPGGKVSDIQIDWRGIEKIKKLENLGIEYSCSLGEMTESVPMSYVGAGLAPAQSANIYDEKGDRKGRPYMDDPEDKIESHFILKNNHIGFKTGKYDKTKTLVIDPTLIWGTYFGGSGSDFGYGVDADALGNVYVVGGTSSTSGIVTSGAFQTYYSSTNPGGGEGFLAKFNSNGARLWATYYAAECYRVKTNSLGNIYVTGYTSVASNLATSGAYQSNFIGTADLLLSCFTTNGYISWATYFGSTSGYGPPGLAADPSGNVYITGVTNLSYGIATTGAYQTSFGGTDDAFLAKFNNKGKIQWSTYYGGTNDDEGAGLAIDALGNIYLIGVTLSTNGIASSGAYQTSSGGYEDAFLVKFTSSGTRLWGTYFGGNDADYGYGVTVDYLGNVYITGQTASISGIATNGAYQTSFSGFEDAFLAKLNTNGIKQWSTYYGVAKSTVGYDIASDKSGNIYFAGFTSSSGISTINGTHNKLEGVVDDFLAEFNSNGSRKWGTYYGYNSSYAYAAGSSGTAVDAIGNVYITGVTSSDSSTATKGAFQTSYAGNTDAFLAKFGNPILLDAGIDSIISPTGNSCKDSIPIIVQLKNYGVDTLNSVSIISSVNGKIQTSYPWSGSLKPDSTIIVNIGIDTFSRGSDTLKVWTQNPNGGIDPVSANDTSTIIIQIHSLPPANAGPDTTLCYDETYTMQGSGGITYTWHPAIYLSSAIDPNAIAILPNTERYELVVSNTYGCIDSAPVLLKVRPKLAVKAIANPLSVCYGQTVILSAQSSGGDSLHYQYHWVNDNQAGDSVIEKPTQSGWHKVILSDNCSPANDIDSVYVTVIPPAKAAFVYVPVQLVKVNQNVDFLNQSSNAARYLWNFGANDTSNTFSPEHIYMDSGNYKITLIAYGLNHCPNDTAFGFIKIFGTQITIYIPNAFSPNGDGINDVFDLSGIGIKSYSYNIYNRWGEHIFDGTDTGWDGKFKGAPVPDGVYIYMVDVVDIGGQHHYVSGNVTVMR